MGYELTTLVNIQFLSFDIIVFIFKNRKTCFLYNNFKFQTFKWESLNP